MANPIIHHIHILCHDLDTMIEFWTEALDAKMIRRRLFFGDPGAELDLGVSSVPLFLRQVTDNGDNGGGGASGLGYDHVALLVDDLDFALEKALKHRHASIHIEPGMTGTMRYCFVKGPDNLLVELMQPPSSD